MARWMLIGFIHGVMNTDNMTISGETIDYGPCAFMEAYDPDTVFSSIDQWGRYAYDNQPVVAAWNLARFAEALLPLLADNVDEGVALAEKAFGVFRAQYDETWTSGMRAKLGLSADVDAQTVRSLVDDVLALLKESRVDYTSFFRGLGHAARGDAEPTRGLFINLAGIDDWIARWRALGPDATLMDRNNPIYIPRNHLVEEALTAATAGELDPLQQLLAAVTAPYDERPGLDRYAAAGARRVRRLPDVLRNLSAGTAASCLAAACRIEPAIRNAGLSRSAGMMGRPAARRSTISASPLYVAYGMISRLTRASSPLTVITCWGLCSHPGQLKSGGRCSGGQLTLIEVISPSNGVRAATRLGNSMVMRSTRGHHAPSMSPPNSCATESRTGLAERRSLIR